jgi:hypothetical protein
MIWKRALAIVIVSSGTEHFFFIALDGTVCWAVWILMYASVWHCATSRVNLSWAKHLML